MESDRRSVWNHHKVMYVINPKGDTCYAWCHTVPLARIPYTALRAAITYQSFGLDRKKTVRKRSFFLAPPAGLEPATSWLTVMRSTDWAKEEYDGYMIRICYLALSHERICHAYSRKYSRFVRLRLLGFKTPYFRNLPSKNNNPLFFSVVYRLS